MQLLTHHNCVSWQPTFIQAIFFYFCIIYIHETYSFLAAKVIHNCNKFCLLSHLCIWDLLDYLVGKISEYTVAFSMTISFVFCNMYICNEMLTFDSSPNDLTAARCCSKEICLLSHLFIWVLHVVSVRITEHIIYMSFGCCLG